MVDQASLRQISRSWKIILLGGPRAKEGGVLIVNMSQIVVF